MSELQDRLPLAAYNAVFADTQAEMARYIRPDELRGLVLDPPKDVEASWRQMMHDMIACVAFAGARGSEIATFAAFGHSFTAVERPGAAVSTTHSMERTHRLGAAVRDAARVAAYIQGCLPREMDCSREGDAEDAIWWAARYEEAFGSVYESLSPELTHSQAVGVIDGITHQLWVAQEGVWVRRHDIINPDYDYHDLDVALGIAASRVPEGWGVMGLWRSSLANWRRSSNLDSAPSLGVLPGGRDSTRRRRDHLRVVE